MDEKTKQKNYQGPSPDEIALVDAARNIGYEFIETKMNKMIIMADKKERQVTKLIIILSSKF